MLQETSDPISRLDALLEIYLDRLDTYQTLREELSKNFSAGFLSLAHANRTGNLGSGRRYGEEGYDERMKAGRRVRIQTKSKADVARAEACRKDVEAADQRVPDSSGGTRLYTTEQFIPSCEDSDDTAHSPVSSEITAQAFVSPRFEKPSTDPRDLNTNTVKSTTSPSSLSPTQPPKHTTNPHSRSKFKSKKPLNPLNWYGVLVPASLRAAQTSFICVVEESIPQLLNTQLEMTDLESQIRELRIEAGLTHLTGQDVDAKELGSTSATKDGGDLDGRAIFKEEHEDEDEDKSIPSKGKMSAGGTRSLSSRNQEPLRPRILKLDG